MDSGATLRDAPGEPRQWSDRARHSWKVWRNYHPSLAYARGDLHTFYVPIDRAAHMAGLSRRNFYGCYLLSAHLPYVVRTWFHGRKMRRKAFVQRSAVIELLARELRESASLTSAAPRRARYSAQGYRGPSRAAARPAAIQAR